MSLTKIDEIEQIDVVANGSVQVRIKTAILENGKEISNSYSRTIIAPGDNFDQESDRVRAICAAVHTPEVILAYQASQEAEV